jgi:hypothetical protein
MFTVKGKGNLNSVNITGMMDNDDFKVYQPPRGEAGRRDKVI